MFKGKTAIVTGGSRGIGEAIVKMLVEEGCQVALTYHSSKEKARKLCDNIKNSSIKVQAYQVDMKDFESVGKFFEEFKKDFSSLDILINNAGIIEDKALMMMSHQDWHNVIATNLNGVFYMTRQCIVTFLKQKKGQIVNISSVSGLVGTARQTNYSASKGGINAFTKALAKEVAAYGIRINAVAPGFIETDMLKDLSDQQKRNYCSSIPLGHFGRPKNVADAVRFLLSDQARYVTGQILIVDGGLAIR